MKIKFFSMAIVGLLFAACSNSDVVEPTDPNNGNKPVVSFSLANASTRFDAGEEPGTAAESAINRLVFYVFTRNGDLLQTNKFDTKQSQYKFAINTTDDDLLAGMDFLVGINQDQIIGIPADATAFNFVKAALLNSLELGPDNSTATPDYYPMSGESTSQNIIKPNEENKSPVTPLTIKVSRLVSKVEAPKANGGGVTLGPNVARELFGEGHSKGEFELEGYVFINGLNKSDAFYTWADEENDWTTWKRDGKDYLSSEFDETGAYTNVYAGSEADDHFIGPAANKTVYVFENQPMNDENEPDLYYDKSTVYSFIIKGKITSEDGSKETIRYWRANLIPDDNHIVVRNAIYRLTINAVNSAGYETPEEAEKQEVVPKNGFASVSITIEVLNWRLKTTSTEL